MALLLFHQGIQQLKIKKWIKYDSNAKYYYYYYYYYKYLRAL